MANTRPCSADDGEFIALAKNLKTIRVTMDKKLVNVFPETAVLLTDAIDH
ncbi:MAG: hypothetical protein L3J88_11780 [Gammaproteobacteria bacterium]|nr:hypothetical protein [Gammaproteobacteria bacterium]MCF6363998.1 hypothetical protein [Gammaproteobacteria bacterium]